MTSLVYQAHAAPCSAAQPERSHEDLLITELQHEVSQLRAQQGSVPHMSDQLNQLKLRYSQLATDKNKNDAACSQKLNEGLKVVQKLVTDLD